MKFTSDKLKEIFGRGLSMRLLLPLLLGALLIALGSFSGGEGEVTATEEDRTAEICSLVEGVGECRVMITYRETDGETRVYAVAVLCDGADSVEVREDLTELICSLYGIGSHRVSILRLNE